MAELICIDCQVFFQSVSTTCLRCEACKRIYLLACKRANWHKNSSKNKARRKTSEYRLPHIARKYKIPLSKLEELMLIKHCEICSSDQNLVIDHHHETGIVRGILCQRCNIWMASLDYPGWLELALGYRAR